MCGSVKSLFKKFKRPSKSQGGFTLIEIAIVMLVVGIGLASFLGGYTVWVTQSRIDNTEVNRKLITLSLDEFKRRYGRYPCPARYDADRDDPDYGKEGNCEDVSVAPGLCQDGICVEEGAREITLKDGTVITPRVRRGAIPFRDMYLAEENTYDKYRGRFSYAVTERLASTETFDVRHGGISVVDDHEPNSYSLVEPEGSALYFVFSHGPDNVGAYNLAGQLIHPCDGTMHDSENCNTSATHYKAIYRHKPASTVPIDTVNASASGPPPTGPVSADVNRHYDDFASYVGNEEKALWKYSEEPGNEQNVHDLLQEGEVLEIGTPTAVADPDLLEDLKVNVDGDAKATEKVSAENLCGPDNTECTQAYLIGGSGMNCDNAGAAGVGVALNDIVCGATATLAASCPDGEFMTGIDNNGQAVCQGITKPKPCAATTKRVCGINKPLVESPRGTVVTLTAGASFAQTWTCRANGGSSQNSRWVNTGESGVCTCTASTVQEGNIPCGQGFGNTVFNRTTTTVCPSGQTTVNDTAAQTCVCAPFTENGTTNCPGNFTGQIPRTRPWTCQGNTPRPGTWTNTPGNFCTCNLPATDVEEDECPNLQDGVIRTTRTLNPATCTYGAGTVTNMCTCNARAPQQRDVGCPAPTTGTYQQQRSFQCPAGTWTGWTDLPNSRQTNCRCIDQKQTRFVNSCTAPNTGGHNEERTVDCNGNPVSGAAGQWQMVGTQQCEPPPPVKVCALTATTSSVGPPGNASQPRVGSSCACGSGNVTCYRNITGPVYQGYDCSCQ